MAEYEPCQVRSFHETWLSSDAGDAGAVAVSAVNAAFWEVIPKADPML